MGGGFTTQSTQPPCILATTLAAFSTTIVQPPQVLNIRAWPNDFRAVLIRGSYQVYCENIPFKQKIGRTYIDEKMLLKLIIEIA
jgi:hypothetical protein